MDANLVQFGPFGLKIRLHRVAGGLLFVQHAQARLDLSQLLVDRVLLFLQVLAGRGHLGGFNYFQVDGPDAQAIARFQY